MKQKLAVARALLHAPSLVFLDEPTAGLDPVAAAALRDDLAALASREGTTVFLTTHNLTEAERLCHTVAVIRAGKIVALGRPDELRASAGAPQLEVRGRGLDERAAEALRGRPEVAGVRAGPGFILLDLRSADVDPAPLVRLLVEAGASVEEVRRQVATLEEVFLDLVVERNDR
jgi:ABC-2 type transport system ATP-binding protein